MSPVTTTAPASGPASQVPARGRRRVLVGAVAGLVVVAVLAGYWLLRPSGDATVPYTDPLSSGTITLCSAGEPVTSGSVDRAPFVDRAVGATGVTAAAATAGRRATLYAFQPRPGTGSAEWSGQLLTAASAYTNAQHPMAAATSADIPLKDFLVAFPPAWDGLVQLRLYLTSPEAGLADHYDTVDVKVDHRTWKVVGRTGHASCTDGDATSNETHTKAGTS